MKKAVSDKSNKSSWLSFEKGRLAEASLYYELPDKILVKTISCDDYTSSAGLDTVDVLIVTVNGHEPEVVKGASKLLKNIRLVTFQSARHQEVISYLSKKGFVLKNSGTRANLVLALEPPSSMPQMPKAFEVLMRRT